MTHEYEYVPEQQNPNYEIKIFVFSLDLNHVCIVASQALLPFMK